MPTALVVRGVFLEEQKLSSGVTAVVSSCLSSSCCQRQQQLMQTILPTPWSGPEPCQRGKPSQGRSAARGGEPSLPSAANPANRELRKETLHVRGHLEIPQKEAAS
jgi:hypothetical protein